jgi:hypothetical protein
MKSALSLAIRKAIRAKYAWPGGYPLYLVMNDGEALCMECARSEYKQIARAGRDNRYKALRSDWLSLGPEINWEDQSLCCVHCNKPIESAYGNDE